MIAVVFLCTLHLAIHFHASPRVLPDDPHACPVLPRPAPPHTGAAPRFGGGKVRRVGSDFRIGAAGD